MGPEGPWPITLAFGNLAQLGCLVGLAGGFEGPTGGAMRDERDGVVDEFCPHLFFPLLAIDEENQRKESDRIPDTRESWRLALNLTSAFSDRCQTGYQMPEKASI